MCIFCDKINKNNNLFETSERIAFFDEHPVSKWHTLLIPKEHFDTYFDLPDSYIKTKDLAIKDVKKILDEKFHPDGYNIGFNCGEAAGQSIMHFHIHTKVQRWCQKSTRWNKRYNSKQTKLLTV